MSRSDRNTIIEVYALLDHANESYLNLNQALVHFRYTIVKMDVGEFERGFREYFGLKAYADQNQDKNISIDNDPVLVTGELFHLLQSESFKESQFLKEGYVLLLKKSFVLFEDTSKSCLKKIGQFKNVVDNFILSLNQSMCIAGYKHFNVTKSFIYIPTLKRTVVRKTNFKSQPLYSPIYFSNKDRYFVKLYLQSEDKLQAHIRKTVLLFCNAVNADNPRSKFLHLMLALESFFQNSKLNQLTSQQFASYLFVLSSDHPNTFETICENTSALFYWKQSLHDDLPNSAEFMDKTIWLENILTEIIRKMIRLNHLKHEVLIKNLEKRFFLITRTRLANEVK